MSSDGGARQGVIEVVLVCATDVLRLGLERLLTNAPSVAVRAHAALPAADDRLVDVCVLSDRDSGDVATTCEAARRDVAAEVVVVLQHADVHLMLDYVGAGACGFVLEDDGAAELTAAVRAAGQGEHFVSLDLLGPLLGMHRAERTSPQDGERRLLRLLAGGHETAEIAAALGVAPKTVRNRSSQLYKRLGVRSRGQAVEVAERRGLLD